MHTIVADDAVDKRLEVEPTFTLCNVGLTTCAVSRDSYRLATQTSQRHVHVQQTLSLSNRCARPSQRNSESENGNQWIYPTQHSRDPHSPWHFAEVNQLNNNENQHCYEQDLESKFASGTSTIRCRTIIAVLLTIGAILFVKNKQTNKRY